MIRFNERMSRRVARGRVPSPFTQSRQFHREASFTFSLFSVSLSLSLSLDGFAIGITEFTAALDDIFNSRANRREKSLLPVSVSGGRSRAHARERALSDRWLGIRPSRTSEGLNPAQI